MKLIPVNALAASILSALREQYPYSRKPKWVPRAMEYAQAMLEVKEASDFYGVDTAESILLEFLKLTDTWKHEEAPLIRRQLRQHLYNAKETHADHQGR